MGEASALPFPYAFEELKPEEKEFCKLHSIHLDLISVGPKKYKELRTYIKDAANIYNMPIRTTDVFVNSYQRSGTTWTQELVWLLANDFDYKAAADAPLTKRYQFLEEYTFMGEEWKRCFLERENNKEEALNIVEYLFTPASRRLLSMPSPRFIKTHLPMSLLPPKLLDSAKVVYIARDPRDVAVSSFYHNKGFAGFGLPVEIPLELHFKDFWQLFTKDLFLFTPYFEHVKEAWALRHHPNLLFLFYEELSKDLPSAVQRIAEFLGKKVTPEQMARLCEHLSIENFKKNDKVNCDEMKKIGAFDAPFVRKGKAGGWRDHFDEDLMENAKQWFKKNLQDTDLRFPQMQ